MLTNYPASIVVHGVALNITVQTYNESLDVGIIACARAMPEVAEFAAQIETAFEEFKGLPAAPAAAAPAPAKQATARKSTARTTTAKQAVAKKKPAAGQAAQPVPKATRTARASAPTAKRASR
jgi:diacylglycerol O-acyltransferase / wax synthase